MRIFLIQLGHVYESDKEKKRAKLIRRDYLLQECGVTLPKPRDDEDPLEGYGSYEMVVTGDQVLSMLERKIEFQMKHEANFPTETTLCHALEQALDKINKLVPIEAGFQADYNHKVDVHMPGNLLMTFNKTMLLEDSCTDVLQNKLDNGWRVIAACPQPDQRRPDYILGRFEPEDELVGQGAKRKHE